jgi:hypothetical protein
MFERHIHRYLSAYHHGEIAAEEKIHVENHLRACSKCRSFYKEIQFGARLASTLQASNAPDSVWLDLSRVHAPRARRWLPAIAVASLGSAVLLLVLLTRKPLPEGPAWDVTGLPGISQLRPGEVLQTGTTSEAEVHIADIGQLQVSPNTRIRLLVTKSDEHRIALDRGKVEAQTWAPPRLFIVDTPLARAIDLGCKYSLQVQDDGSSLLHVTLGLVALERDKRETIVPAGAFCRTRRGVGPGTPFFEDSTAELQAALQKVDSLEQGPERSQELQIVLREAHVRDALSLWYLLPHVDVSSRGLIYDRLAQLLPPPANVTRDGIVALDENMLHSWEKVVSQLWQ